MIEFQPLTLEDKAQFDQAYRKGGHEGSECTFTNLFMWRLPLKISWAQVGKGICVLVSNDGAPYILPPCGPSIADQLEMMDLVAGYFRTNGDDFLVKGVETALATSLLDNAPGYLVERDRDEDDYVYEVTDLVELKGRKYEQKRHHIGRFLRENPDYEYETMNSLTALDCMRVALEWMERRDSDDAIVRAEMTGIVEALQNFEELGLRGGLIRIDDRIEAFTLGEALSDDTVVIHTEKADPSFTGLYQVINRDYLKQEWSYMRFVNREEDMGIPGLRQAKRSYCPVRMIEKYTVRLR